MSTTFNNYMNNSFNIKSTDSYKKVQKEMSNNSFECVIKKV